MSVVSTIGGDGSGVGSMMDGLGLVFGRFRRFGERAGGRLEAGMLLMLSLEKRMRVFRIYLSDETVVRSMYEMCAGVLVYNYVVYQ